MSEAASAVVVDDAARAAAAAALATAPKEPVAAVVAPVVPKEGEPAKNIEPTPKVTLELEPPKPEPVDTTVVVEYNPTGDAGLDLALQFVGQRGFGPDRPEIVAATKGDFAPLEAALKALGDKAKGYEAYITVAKANVTRVRSERAEAEAKTVQAVVAAVGGEAAWTAIHAWVVAEADQKQKQQITAAFVAGDLAATAMARQLADLYRQSGASTLAPKSALKPDAAGAKDEAGKGALTTQEFSKEIAKLDAKYGNRTDQTPEYQSLVARWRANPANRK